MNPTSEIVGLRRLAEFLRLNGYPTTYRELLRSQPTPKRYMGQLPVFTAATAITWAQQYLKPESIGAAKLRWRRR